MKKLKIDYFRRSACAGAPAPPRWNVHSARVLAVDSETGRIRVRTIKFFTASEGDVLDYWRVESVERVSRLRLAAEMRMPDRAWLEFEVQSGPEGEGSRIRQTATFDPLGLTGLAYWYAVWPLHQLVFAGMLKGLARKAETLDRREKEGEPAAS